jgi:hypothetical protein
MVEGNMMVSSLRVVDALAIERAVDAGWTSRQRPAKPLTISSPRPRGRQSRRAVDARWTPCLVVVALLDNERS